MNIILIGMPGSGKSSAGILSAKILGAKFIDTDLLIQCEIGRLLQDIIENDGVEAFLDIEQKIICGVNETNAVIATGGSAVCRENSIAHLKKSGFIVYLKASTAELKKRISNINTRGIAAKHGTTIEEIFAQRSFLYEKFADYTIDCTSLTPEQTAEQIVKCIT